MWDEPIKFDMISRYAIESEPTVEAIPIEWIKKEIETYFREDSMDDYEYYYTDTLKLMLERWEKENDKETEEVRQ